MERKLATVLFVDLVGSTALVTASDPEVVRRRVNSFFEHVSQCIAAHGGIVEKFAGDAVMAAFGIPTAHEDDAERAVRAAVAILDSVHDLGLEARIGDRGGRGRGRRVRLDVRHRRGGQRRRAAPAERREPGEILIGPFARRLTLSVVDTEERGFLELKGFDEPLPAWRLVGIQRGQRAGAVGRAPASSAASTSSSCCTTRSRARSATAARISSRSTASRAWARAGSRASSRDGVEGATVLVGRSLPYGEGVTYWPLAEMVKAAAGITDDDPVQEAVAKLRACCGDDAVADLLALAVGVLEGIEAERSQQEIAWAAREWAAELADAQPLVLVFEDIHWAEEPLLELIEHLAERVKDAPLLIVCLARPELLDIRPGWGGGRLRATAIELEPLAAGRERGAPRRAARRSRALGRRARGRCSRRPRATRSSSRRRCGCCSRAATAAKRIPDTLQALIAARIDRLPRNEKRLLQRAVRDRPHLLGGRGRAPRAGRRGPRAGARQPARSATSSSASSARRSRASTPTASSTC